MAGLIDDFMRGVREVPANLRELLTTPKTLIVMLVGLGLLIYVGTNPLMWSIFPWVILFFGYVGYNLYTYRKAGYVLDRKRKAALAITCSLILTLSIYGYEISYVNDMRLARVPGDILERNSWSRYPAEDSSESMAGFLVRIEVRCYRYDYSNPSAPPYPGALWLVTIKSVLVPGQDMIQREVQRQIDGYKVDGLTIDKESKTSGKELLGNGHTADYTEYQAVMGTSSTGFFREVNVGAKLKIRAEWWSCSDQGTAVVAIGVSQWGIEPEADRFGRRQPTPPDDFSTEYSVQRIIYNILCA